MNNSSLTFDFPAVSGKSVAARFDGGDITSDTGFLLVAGADRKINLTASMAAAVTDRRQASKVACDIQTLFKERTYAIALGYEDANDLDYLRADPSLKLACGRAPKTGRDLASQPTLSRLENALDSKDLVRMAIAVARRVVDQLPSDTKDVILDIDEMEDPCHGQQELEFYNAHYGTYCYLPLLLFITDETGRHRMGTSVLRSGKTGCLGVRGVIKRAVGLLRSRFPEIQIELRGDALFGNDKILRACDKLGIDYTLGLASNSRLIDLSTSTQMDACIKYSQLKYLGEDRDCQEFAMIDYKADSWDKSRKVIVKAEITKARNGQLVVNDRYVVTNREYATAEDGYHHYCQRGDIENRIKEYNLDLNGGRTSCHRFMANQCRVLLHLGASVLMSMLQEAAQSTSLAKAQMGTLRLKLLKIGARITESVRRVWIHMSSTHPEQHAWQTIHAALSG
jgi:hypothetical protein